MGIYLFVYICVYKYIHIYVCILPIKSGNEKEGLPVSEFGDMHIYCLYGYISIDIYLYAYKEYIYIYINTYIYIYIYI
jgi:hypothetical protein